MNADSIVHSKAVPNHVLLPVISHFLRMRTVPWVAILHSIVSHRRSNYDLVSGLSRKWLGVSEADAQPTHIPHRTEADAWTELANQTNGPAANMHCDRWLSPPSPPTGISLAHSASH